MHVEIKKRYDYHFQIMRITESDVGPDLIEVVEDDLSTMVDAIPLLEDMPEVVGVSYHITVAYMAA